MGGGGGLEETYYHTTNMSFTNITSALQLTDHGRNVFEDLMPKEELQARRRLMDTPEILHAVLVEKFLVLEIIRNIDSAYSEVFTSCMNRVWHRLYGDIVQEFLDSKRSSPMSSKKLPIPSPKQESWESAQIVWGYFPHMVSTLPRRNCMWRTAM
jgi:hypothetical protein